MTALVDTNVLVYRFDPSEPSKQKIATELLRAGLESGALLIPHQALVELFAATTRSRGHVGPIFSKARAAEEVEAFIDQFTILYPDEGVIRAACRGVMSFGLSWFDAHIWAYADRFGVDTLLSEDFQHGRSYGGVLVENPFLASGKVE